MGQRFYKFRSLNNIRWFLDVLLYKRLYAARYDELNDPMEGHYLTLPHNVDLIKQLRDKKTNIRICSLTNDYKHSLLWTHYADSHRGCCIEVDIKRNIAKKINYVDSLPLIFNLVTPKDVLSHKSKIWEYENEYRVFSEKIYVDVEVRRIIFGNRVKKSDYEFFKLLISSIDNTVIVEQMASEEIFDGFNE